jgi:hypothetical protein
MNSLIGGACVPDAVRERSPYPIVHSEGVIQRIEHPVLRYSTRGSTLANYAPDWMRSYHCIWMRSVHCISGRADETSIRCVCKVSLGRSIHRSGKDRKELDTKCL